MSYWTDTAGWRSGSNNQAERLGHPGRYYSAVTVTSAATASFTGSQFGYGAVIRGASAVGFIDLSGGGRISLADLVVGQPYELSPAKVACTGGTVYVLKRQQ